MDVVIEKFELTRVRGSLVRNSLTGVYRFYMGGKENVKVSTMKLGFYNKGQVDDLINQLLEVRKTLEK